MDCQKLKQIYKNVCDNDNDNNINLIISNDNIHLPFYKNYYNQNTLKNECKETKELIFACCSNNVKKNKFKKECNDLIN